MTDGGLLGRMAIERGLITTKQHAQALRRQGEHLERVRYGEVLQELGFATPFQVEELLLAQQAWLQTDPQVRPNRDGSGSTNYQVRTVEDLPAVQPRSSNPKGNKDSPEDKRLQTLLNLAVKQGVSDLHLQSGSPPFFRLHGRLVSPGGDSLQAESVTTMIRSALSPSQWEDLQRNGDLNTAWQSRIGLRCRLSCFHGDRGPGAVFRLIGSAPPALDALRLPSLVARLTSFHQGLVVISGPTGCGKSTTLAALIHLINEERKDNILILEDPIEILHPSLRSNVIQRQIPEHTKSFSTALHSALREDPDVIVVGEMRDQETVALAMTAAETGHLVFASMDTETAAATVDRIVGFFPADEQPQARTMLSESLRGVLCQELHTTTDGQGRVPAVELLFNTPPVANLIREGRSFQIPNLMQTGRSMGMRTMAESLGELRQSGLIGPSGGRRGPT